MVVIEGSDRSTEAKVLVMITGFAGGTMVANQIGVDFVLNLGNNSMIIFLAKNSLYFGS
jgi:Na+-transporting NADH:ubiquinone oxidoreductase subunit NqrC